MNEAILSQGLEFTDHEAAVVAYACVRYHGEASQDDVERVLEWALQARVDAALLRLVMSGQLAIFFDAGGEMHCKLADPKEGPTEWYQARVDVSPQSTQPSDEK